MIRIGVLTDLHLAPAGAGDTRWNNVVRVSEARELLAAATARVTGQVDHLLVLGDVADRGDEACQVDALTALAAVGVPVWAVPGNHDVSLDPEALVRAAARVPGVEVLDARTRMLGEHVAVCGVRLVSDDGGATCTARDLPLELDRDPPLLVVAGHYPVLSAKPRLHARGLRYPGDLLNRRDFQHVVAGRPRPTLAFHGHLHTAVDLAHAHLLQIGCAALVEWPHAWTLLELDPSARSVTVTRHTVREGAIPDVDTALAPARSTWRYEGVMWQAKAEPAKPAPASIPGVGSSL
jgi:calcineurin-like phosphoesterase family protein